VDVLTAFDIDAVDRDMWNEAVVRLGGSVYHRHEWLSAVEHSGLIDVDARHLLATENGRAVGMSPCYLTRYCPKLEMFRSHYVAAKPGGSTALVVHSMYAQSSEILADGPETRRTLLAATEEQWRRARADFLMFPLVPAGDPLLSLLAERRYAIGLLSCTNYLDVRWPTFGAYLAGRPSAKRRNITKGMLRSESAGLTASIEPAAGHIGLLADLAARTADRHGSPVFFTRSFLKAIVAHLGDVATVVVLRGGGRPVLACLVLCYEGELTPWCVGLDYDVLGQFNQYNYLYVTLIRLAIETRMRKVNFGRSTYVVKRKCGCRQRPVYLAVAPGAENQATGERWVDAVDRHAREELATTGGTRAMR
jgi:hypothetical protein